MYKRQAYPLQNRSLDLLFSENNSPLDGNSAVLLPGEMGRVNVLDPGTGHVNVGKISWHSDSCIYRGLMVRARNRYVDGAGRLGDVFYLNGGMPF